MERVDRIIGIDPGVTGGICILDMKGDVELIQPFPLLEEEKKNHRKGHKSATRIERYYDRSLLYNDLKSNGVTNAVAYLELVSSRPGEGAASSFKFGDCFGQLKMLMTCLGVPVRMVHPVEWCKAMHTIRKSSNGKEVPMSAKERSWEAFEMRFTSIARARYKKIPDGMVDAALIAEFGRLRVNDGVDLWRFK